MKVSWVVFDPFFFSNNRWSSVVSLGASNFVYFYMYNGLKIALNRYYARQGKSTTIGPIMNLLLASIAGVINVLMTTPLWVVGSR